MNSRLDWLVLSDYYSIYVTNAPPNLHNPNLVIAKGFTALVLRLCAIKRTRNNSPPFFVVFNSYSSYLLFVAFIRNGGKGYFIAVKLYNRCPKLAVRERGSGNYGIILLDYA